MDVCLDAGVRPIDLIVRTAVWVSPESFRYLPVWYPEAWRKAPLYSSTWTRRYTNTNQATGIKVDKSEANERAAKALAKTLGAKDTPGWTCCHIWGIGDEQFEKSNSIVQDSRFNSCTANMVYLPAL